MPRMPLSETSAKWSLLCVCIVFAFIFLFNTYKIHGISIKVTYKTQILLSAIIILLANVLTTLLKHWIYRSIGFVICGLIWLLHPVLIKQEEASRLTTKTIKWVKISGVILILIGIFTRSYFY